MSQECCRKGLKDFGRNGVCVTQIDVPVRTAFTPTFGSLGVANRIDLDATFEQADLDALITNANPTLRMVASPKLVGATLPIADTVFDEATDGTKSFVREGIWSMNAEFRDKDAVPAMLKSFKALRCKDVSAYIITRSNQLIGRKKTGDNQYFYPLLLNTGSIDAKLMFRTDSETNKGVFNVDFDNLMKQEDIYILDGNDLGVNFLEMRQLTDVNIAVSNITATTITIDVKSNFVGGLQPNNDVVGQVLASFVLKNLTDATTVVPSSVVEDINIDGRYLVTFSAQTAGDIMEISMALSTYFTGSTEFTAV